MSYEPSRPAALNTIQELRAWVEEEFNQISRGVTSQSILQLEVQNVAPEKPREGMLVFADGVNWNPGAGRGTYEYRSAAWHKL